MIEKVCTVIFLIRDGQVLLAMKKRGFGSGRYNGVGGKLDIGESLEKALIREAEEEIGATPVNYWKVAELNFLQSNKGEPWRMYVHAFLCDKWDGEPIETEEMAPKWFDNDTIPYDIMWQGDQYWLPQVLAGNKISGEYTFDEQDRMLSHTIAIVGELPGIIPYIQSREGSL